MKRTKDGKFTSGNTGRPVGAKSKRTTELRQKFLELVEANESTLQEDIKSLKPKERLDIILNLASYLIPKLKSADLTIQDKTENSFQPIKIERIIIDNKENESK